MESHLRREERIKAPVKVRILEAVLGDQDEEAMQRKEALVATAIHRPRQEVGEQERPREAAQERARDGGQRALVERSWQRHGEHGDPRIAAQRGATRDTFASVPDAVTHPFSRSKVLGGKGRGRGSAILGEVQFHCCHGCMHCTTLSKRSRVKQPKAWACIRT